MSFKLGAITGDLVLQMKGWDRNVNRALTDTKRLKKGVNSMRSGLSTLGKEFRLIGAAAAAGMALAVKEAMRIEEAENLFNVSLGKMADDTRAWSKELASALGLSQYDIREQVATLTDITSAMGFSQEAAVTMSKEMTKLTQDLASFKNLNIDEAFAKITSGLTGEAEPLKRIGILINDNTIKEVAYRKGIAKTGEQLTEQQKVLARFAAIMEQTGNAQGDLARTADSATNQQRRLGAQFQELRAEVGKALLPTYKNLLQTGLAIVGNVKGWVTLNPQLVASIANIGGKGIAAAGGIWVLNKAIVKTKITVIALSKVTAGAWAIMTAPITLVVAGILSIGAALYSLVSIFRQNWEAMLLIIKAWAIKFTAPIEERFGWFIGAASQLFWAWKQYWNQMLDVVRDWSKVAVTGAVSAIAYITEFLKTRSREAASAAADAAAASFIVKGTINVMDGVKTKVDAKLGEMEKRLGRHWEFITDGAGLAWDSMKAQIVEDMGAIMGFLEREFPKAAAGLKNAFSTTGGGEASIFEGYSDLDFADLLAGVQAQAAKAAKDMGLSTAGAAKQASQGMQNAAQETQRFGNEIQGLESEELVLIDLGSAAEDATSSMQSVGGMFSQVGQGLTELGKSFGDKMTQKIGAVSSAIGGVIGAYVSMQIAATTAAAAATAAWLAILGPIYLVVAAITAVITIFGVFKDETEEVATGLDRIMEEFGKAVDQWADRLTDTLVDFIKTGKASFKDFVDSILEDMLRITIRYGLVQPIVDVFSAKGNAFKNGEVVPFAKGGVISQPTLFPLGMAGERGAEAIMPLGRTSSGDLGVKGSAVNVVINNQSGGQAELRERTTANGEREVEVFIRNALVSLMGDGSLDRAMANNYGARRAPA